ncbi:MAG: lamin tail domain-containing protein [Verrucomicrobiales bacterium]
MTLPVMKRFLRTLTLAVACGGFIGAPLKLAAQNGVIREVYADIFGGLSGLTNDFAFPGNPSLVTIQPDFEAPAEFSDFYGQRMRGYLLPPQTGFYTFWISSDDQSELYLSTDESPANKILIGSVLGWTSPREWTAEPNQMSVPIRLDQGKRYYIEALMVEGGGGDHLAVRWQLPEGTIEEPISGSRIIAELIPPQISRQPQSVRVGERESATFAVQLVNRGPVSYQWQLNGANIPNATNAVYSVESAKLSQNGSRYRVVITNAFGVAQTSEATLNVTPDQLQPTVQSVQNFGENNLVIVTFSEPVSPNNATNILNYSVNNNLSILSATLDEDGRTVVLRTTPMSFGSEYEIVLNNITDTAAQPNAIEPDTYLTFGHNFAPIAPDLIYGGHEPLGPSSRRTGLVLSEIMYHPKERADGKNLEFVEIYNSNETLETISGFRLQGVVNYTFPAGTFIPGKSFILVSPNPTDMQTVYGLSRVYGGFPENMPDSGGVLELYNDQGALLLQVEFSDDSSWPVSADGTGHSLTLARPSYGEADPKAWSISETMGGTPGRAETAVLNPLRTLVINEFLAHTDAPQVDFIELFNYSNKPLDISGVWITDEPATNKFRVPANTILQPFGFISFTQDQLNFALGSGGEQIFLLNPQGTRVIDSIRFGAQALGVSMGRFPDGSAQHVTLSAPTPSAANSKPLQSNIVINEIMYHPISNDSDDEYIELYNRGTTAVNLGGWKLQEAISYTFPPNTVVPAGGYLVVARNMARLLTNYSQLHAGNTVGNYSGSLSNNRELLKLLRADFNIATNGNQTVTNINYILHDQVSYVEGGRWGKWSDGGGSSLELLNPNADNDFPSNWADSDESGKSSWTIIERRGILDHGSTNATATNPSKSLHILMMDGGEALIDQVAVIPDGGTNILANPDFESGLGNWKVLGTHEDSSLDASTLAAGRQSLHIRSTARGDTSANRVQGALRTGLTNGAIATLRAEVRWLRGDPEILLRLHGNYLEAAGKMDVPRNLGSPGLQNSAFRPNTGPAIENVSHFPVLPVANQSVLVKAEINDPDRVAFVNLVYRLDPSTNYITVPMQYNGAGYFSGTIPGQAQGNMVAFYVDAADSKGLHNYFPAKAPFQEGLVRFGEFKMASNFGSYRLWLSSRNLNQWTTRPSSSNKDLDATFVYNDHRVIYNMGTYYSGSPFHWPGYNGPLGNDANYVMHMPEDNLFLGQTDFVLNLPSNMGSDETGVREQVFFWMLSQLDQPFNYRRYHHLFINGVDRGAGRIFEDTQQPNSDFLEQWFPEDPEGELYKIEDWFEFNDSFGGRFNLDASMIPVITTNLATGQREYKQERYRWTFRKRAVSDSHHDYSELFRLLDAVNNPDPVAFGREVEALVNIDEWMGAIALRHMSGDWDAFGYRRGKNMYAYKPTMGKWELLHWDVAFAFGLGDGTTADLFDTRTGSEGDPVTARMMQFPAFRRAYLRALHEAANGPMVASRVNPVIDAKYNSLLANGIPASSPQSVKTWIANRRSYILSELGSVTAPFAITVNGGRNFSTNRNYIQLTGTAPVQVKTIRVNGVEYPVTWTGVTTWSIPFALPARQNLLTIQGYDSDGNQVAGASSTMSVTYTGATEQALDRVVINEINYRPSNPDAEFIELHNTSRTVAFDLSGLRLNGLGFTFKAGSVIPPGGFLVLARDPLAFGELYGWGINVADIYAGNLDNAGETLTLAMVDAENNEQLISSVTYDDAIPWPQLNSAIDQSLQLIDATRDETRLANWRLANPTPGSVNIGKATLAEFPLLWINEVLPSNTGSISDAAGQRDPWLEVYNSSATAISLAGLFLSDDVSNLQKWAFPNGASIGAGERKIIWLDGDTAQSTSTEWHANFRSGQTSGMVLLTGMEGGGVGILDYARYDSLPQGRSFGAFPEGQAQRKVSFFHVTPGAANNNAAAPVQVVINEWMAGNTSTIADPDDMDFDDWFELHNPGDETADLSGYSLTDNLDNPRKVVVPQGVTIPPGGFLLVWADEEIATTGQLHVGFKLSLGGESIGLYSPAGTLVDSVTFGQQTNNVSQGRSPNGSANIVFFTSPTPGFSNGGETSSFRIASVSKAGNNISINWNSTAGQTYQVQAKNSLSDTTWTTLSTITADGLNSSFSESATQQTRYYRVVQP